jgi:PAS domain S-box-containing protein
MDRHNVSVTLTEGKTVIGTPVVGKKLGAPVFSLSAPIVDGKGKVLGALVGTVNLGLPSFLDKVTHGHFGKSGGYLLNATQSRLIVTATDPSRIMQPLPAPGVNTMLDRYVQGYEGYGVSVNSRGVEELTAAKSVPIAGWFLGLAVPAEDAFSPITAMQQRIFIATLLLTLLAGGLTWWALRRELAPLQSTAKALAQLGNGNRSAPVLPVTRQDEIGELVGAFNQLLDILGQREAELRQSEAFKSGILDAMSSHVAVLDQHGVIVAVNTAWSRFAYDNGSDPGQSALRTGIGVNYLEICQNPDGPTPEGAQTAANGIQQVLQGKRPSFSLEYPCHAPGELRWFHLMATPLGPTDEAGVVVVHTNITEQRNYQIQLARYRDHLEDMVAQQTSRLEHSNAALAESEALFRMLALNTSDGLAVFENNTIVYVSDTYKALLGFSKEEEMGRGEDAITALIHPQDVERVLGTVHTAMQNKMGRVVYTYRARHKRGHYIWREDSARFTYDEAGLPRRTYIVARDVSERIAIQDKLHKTTQLLEQTGAVAKVGGWEVDPKTRLVSWSAQVFQIFEREPCGRQTVEQASSQYLPESQSKIRTAVAQALELGTPWNLELQAVTDEGHVRWVHTLGKVEQTGENEVRVFGSIHDITEEVLSRHAREDHQRSLQVCFDNQQTGVAVFSETVLLYCNPAFRYLLGYAATDSLEHLSMGSLVPSADQHYLNARHKRAKSYGETLPPKLIKLSGNGGVVVTCLLSGSIVPWNGEPQFLASVSPLGDSIRVEQEIRASEERYERLLVTQLEQQQTHIARELHDSMGSRLAGVVMLLGGVVQKHPELAVEIKMALDQIQIAAQSSRALAHSLVPVDALPGAFWRSLERLCLEYAKLASVECLFSMDGDFDEIDAEIGTHLFRIAQEALVNAVKHGHASRIEVILEEREDSLAMTVVDNGSQLSPQPGGTSSSSGIGLKSMQARAKMVGGAFKWYVNDDGGMTVSVVWGLEPL